MLILICLVLAGVVICAANRFHRPNLAATEPSGPKQDTPAGADIEVLSWNLGYAALGRNADMFVDGGRSLRALPHREIAEAADQIAAFLADGRWDVICLQENAKAGFLTRGIDVAARISEALPGRQQVFWTDLKTVLLPPPLQITHGMSTFCARHSDVGRVMELPGAETRMVGLFKKSYVALVNRMPIAGTNRSWVIFHIHLPVYKTTQAARIAQLTHMFDLAGQEYARGNPVVIAGDWNTRLCAAEFAHQTSAEHLSWVTDLPQESLPEGWQIIVETKTPSARALHEPFVAGQTFTTILDGFCISPNVRAHAVRTHDLGFAFTDHHPVEARFTFTP